MTVCTRTNEILSLGELMGDIESGSFNLSYPITFDPFTFQQYNLPAYLGGVQFDEMGVVVGVEAVALNYFLDIGEEWLVEVGDRWERRFLEVVGRFEEEDLQEVEVAMFVSSTPAWEMEKSKDSITPHLLVNIVIMICFCLGASAMSDAVRSKPLIGFLGLLSACLGTMAGFGFVCYMGVDFIALCLAAPFLLLGIGIDDTFVMMSAWRRTSSQTSVPERLGQAFSDAAVSITVTSVTDFLSFIAGVITPFPCVRIFCLYTGTAVAFIYVWHLTLFGACLALSGHAEKNNRHGLLCFKTEPKSLSSNRNWFYRAFCTGGINPNDPYNPKDNRDHAGMVFLRDKLGYALSLKWVKSLVLIVFTAYIVVSIWGITNIKEGLEKRNTMNYDSYSLQYYDMDDKYYKDFRYPINLIISGDILYSSPEDQERIETVLKTFENSSFIAEGMTTSWLRDFLGFVERNRGYDDMDIRVGTEKEFVSSLQNLYLADPSTPLHLDVEFDGDRIVAARFLIQGYDIQDTVQETAMVKELRTIADIFTTETFKVNIILSLFILDCFFLKPYNFGTFHSIKIWSLYLKYDSSILQKSLFFLQIYNKITEIWQ